MLLFGRSCYDNCFEDICSGNYVCDHFYIAASLNATNHNGCFGAMDFYGFTTPADRGQVSANLNTTNYVQISRFGIGGVGYVTPADRGIISANLALLCSRIPYYMHGSGMSTDLPVGRFGLIGTFNGEGLTCGEATCP